MLAVRSLPRLTIHAGLDTSSDARPSVLKHQSLRALSDLCGSRLDVGAADVLAQLCRCREEDVGVGLAPSWADFGRVGGQDRVGFEEGEELWEVGLTSERASASGPAQVGRAGPRPVTCGAPQHSALTVLSSKLRLLLPVASAIGTPALCRLCTSATAPRMGGTRRKSSSCIAMRSVR